MFQRFVFNLKGKYRKETLEGRPHLVVSAAMLGEEVIEGSAGAIFYPKEENAKDPSSWNGMPLVVYHPEMNGLFVSARSPDVFNTRKIGVVLNTSHADEKLRCEAWFDEERTREIDERVYDAILNERAMEISTGLGMDLDRTPGEYNGKKYVGVARNHKPDHLAILPDKIGAYSVAMGGGLFANESKVVFAVNSRYEDRKLEPEEYGDPMNCQFPVRNQEDLENAAMLLHRAVDPNKVKRRLHFIANKKGLKVPEAWSLTANEISFSTKEALISKALASTFGEKGNYWQGWIQDVFDSYVVFYNNGKLWMCDYTSDQASVTIKGQPVEVVRTTDYQPVKNEGGVKETETMAFDKKAHINSLIGNGWAETDRAELEKLPDSVLEKIKATNSTPVVPVAPPSPPPAPAPVANGGPMTLEAFLQGAPPEVRKQVTNGLKADKKRKDDVIGLILANTQNPVFTKEFLETKDPEELEGWWALLQANNPNITPTAANNGMFVPGYVPGQPYYGGAVGAVPFAANQNIPANAPLEDPLIMPELFPAKK